MSIEDLSSLHGEHPEKAGKSPFVLDMDEVRNEFIASIPDLPPFDPSNHFAEAGRDLTGLTHIIAGKAAEHGFKEGLRARFRGRLNWPLFWLAYDSREPTTVVIHNHGNHYLLQEQMLYKVHEFDRLLEGATREPLRVIQASPADNLKIFARVAEIVRPNGSARSILVSPWNRPQGGAL